jgi:hypothetical protein
VVNRKNIALDLAIELAGSAIVAVIAWLATVASRTIAIPTWRLSLLRRPFTVKSPQGGTKYKADMTRV